MSINIIRVIKPAAIRTHAFKKAESNSDNLYSDQPSSAGVSSEDHDQVSCYSSRREEF